ncbi:MAG: RHS repeat-associated core domain-containing protein [Oscillospiraceae bacterium]|nr:RHS repeat-associated core domain-containing protein [Oscillospiraceae bacterium]
MTKKILLPLFFIDLTEAENTYDPYGNQLIDNSDCLNPYRYNNQYFDYETNYIYLRHRYYDTTLGRFISEDPIFDGWNWYVYAGNKPVMYHDPMGLAIKIIDNDNGDIFNNLQSLTNHTLGVRDDGSIFIRNLATGRRNLTLTNGNTLIERLIDNTNHTTTIQIADFSGFLAHDPKGAYGNILKGRFNITGSGSSSTIFFDPSDQTVAPIINASGNLRYNSISAPHIILAHELIHADRAMRGRCLDSGAERTFESYSFKVADSSNDWRLFGLFNMTGTRTITQQISRNELAVIGFNHTRSGDITENQIRKEQGVLQRGGGDRFR